MGERTAQVRWLGCHSMAERTTQVRCCGVTSSMMQFRLSKYTGIAKMRIMPE